MMNLCQTVFKIIALLAAIMIVLKICLIFLWPFLVSAFVVLFIEPMIKVFMQAGCSRKISVSASYFLGIAALATGSWMFSNYMYHHASGFIRSGSEMLNVIFSKTGIHPFHDFDYISFAEASRDFILSSKESILNGLLSTFQGFMNLVVIVLSSFLLSLDLDKLVSCAADLLPNRASSILALVGRKLMNIMKLELFLIVMTTALTILGLMLLGINNALTIGIICGILDVLPIVGTALVFVPLIIYEFVAGCPITGIGLILLFILLQAIRQVLAVKLVGEKLDLHPLTAMISLYCGVYIYGMPGLVLGPILAVISIELCHEYAGRSKITES